MKFPFRTEAAIVKWNRKRQAAVFVDPAYTGKIEKRIKAFFPPGPSMHFLIDRLNPNLEDLSEFVAVYDLMADGRIVQRPEPVAPTDTTD